MEIGKYRIIKHLDKSIGRLRQDGVFVQHKNSSHLFRMFGDGLGLSYNVIKKLKDLGCWKIIILLHFQKRGKIIGKCEICGDEYSETEKIETTPNFFIEKGKIWKDGEQDYQRIIPLQQLRQKELMQVIR